MREKEKKSKFDDRHWSKKDLEQMTERKHITITAVTVTPSPSGGSPLDFLSVYTRTEGLPGGAYRVDGPTDALLNVLLNVCWCR